MLKKLVLAGVLVAGLALSSQAANTPTYTNVAGQVRDAQGVSVVDINGQPSGTSCQSQTSATITAAATTQIVALSGTTTIRVCFYQVGIATTGTYQFVRGTGSNCGTGTANITPATSLTAGNVVTAGGAGHAVFTTNAGDALCVSAVTGNVQVFVRYAQI